MFGPRITTVFRSKWRAVWFVVSVLIGVYFMIPSNDEALGDNADVKAVMALVAPAPPAPASHHAKNPWAK